MKALTLTEAFASRGYSLAVPASQHASYRHIVRAGRIVGASVALGSSAARRNGWVWLARLDRKVAALSSRRSA